MSVAPPSFTSSPSCKTLIDGVRLSAGCDVLQRGGNIHLHAITLAAGEFLDHRIALHVVAVSV